MTHDVTQWLAEIKSLQRQLAEMRQERDEAYNSASNWRRLYETEAQQRRTEAQLLQQTVADLRNELSQLRGGGLAVEAPPNQPETAAEIEQFGEGELRRKLLEVTLERDRLRQALQTEKADHAQTRQSLTTALGDAVDQLAKERGEAPKTASSHMTQNSRD